RGGVGSCRGTLVYARRGGGLMGGSALQRRVSVLSANQGMMKPTAREFPGLVTLAGVTTACLSTSSRGPGAWLTTFAPGPSLLRTSIRLPSARPARLYV